MHIGMRMQPPRAPVSIIAQAIGVLRAKGGSWWQPGPAYTFTGSDGVGGAVDGSDAGYGVDLCATYGPQLVGDAWAGIFGGAPSLSSGTLTVTATEASPYAGASQAIALQAGRTYQASYEVVDASQSDGVYLIVGSDSVTAPPRSLTLGPHTTAGTYTAIFTAQADAAGYLSVSAGNGGMAAGETIAFRNISVREIIGRPLFQSTTVFKPKLRLIGGRWAWQFDGIDDYLGTTSKTGESGYLAVAFAESGARWQALLGSGGQTTGDAGISLGLTGGNELSLLSGNASVANSRYIASSAKPAGACVASATWGSAPADVSILYDGAELAFRATAYSQQSESAAGLVMGRISTTTTDFFGGEIFAAAYCPTILSAAEKLIVERAMAQVGGITI